MFPKGWERQNNVAMGTGHQHVKRLPVFKTLRWCGKFTSCGRRKANLFLLWGFKQGFGGQWLVAFFPFGTDIFPRRCILRGGRGNQGGRRLWWITAESWSWLARKNFCQLIDCTALILLKESIGIAPSCVVCCDLQQTWVMGRDSGPHLTVVLQLNTLCHENYSLKSKDTLPFLT